MELLSLPHHSCWVMSCLVMYASWSARTAQLDANTLLRCASQAVGPVAVTSLLLGSGLPGISGFTAPAQVTNTDGALPRPLDTTVALCLGFCFSVAYAAHPALHFTQASGGTLR